MRISDIRDPNLFQRLVRKLMICEHGIDYQVVDDSGGDGGLDGFNRSTGDLHAIYCPEKPVSARYRTKFRADLEKAVLLRDGKQYAVKKFVFITPEPLREPDQRMLRDLTHQRGFVDGINISAEHLEVLFAKHEELLPQFPELSYPQLEKTLKHVVGLLEQIQGSQASSAREADPGKRYAITGAAAQVLTLAVKAANKVIEGTVEAEEIIRLFDLTKEQYKDAVDELNTLGLIDVSLSSNAPGGYQRVRLRPNAFVRVASQVLPEVDAKADLEKLLLAFGSGDGEYVLATAIVQISSVPLARAQMLINYLKEHNLVETMGMAAYSDSLLFHYGRILPLGKRVLEGKDDLPA